MALQPAREVPLKARLFWADVLRRAVFDYVLYKDNPSKRQYWRYASQYIFSVGMRYENGVSFEEVCELFNWDADYLRRLTLSLTKSDINRLDTSSFKDDFKEDLTGTIHLESGQWDTFPFAIPMYSRMITELVHVEQTLVPFIPPLQWSVPNLSKLVVVHE